MRPSAIAEALRFHITANIPAYIAGPPGAGKTETCVSVAQQFGHVIVLHGPTMQVEDLGLPIIHKDAGTHAFTRPDWMPIVGDARWDQYDGVVITIVVDEVAGCNNDQQKGWAHIIHERTHHGHRLRDNVRFLTTGNRVADRTGANRMLPHLMDRMTPYEYEFSLEDFKKFCFDHDVEPVITAFANFRPDDICHYDPSQESSPTPRAWVQRVDRKLKGGFPRSILQESLSGDVGKGAAAEFMAFLTLAEQLPDPSLIIRAPLDVPVPREANVKYALAGALAHRADKDTFGPIMQFAMRPEFGPAFATLVVRDAIERDQKLCLTKSFTDWAVTHGKMLE